MNTPQIITRADFLSEKQLARNYERIKEIGQVEPQVEDLFADEVAAERQAKADAYRAEMDRRQAERAAENARLAVGADLPLFANL